ncbi:hypothetical protein Asbog_01373 [Asaia bogorensis NBRC 16594]|uniref:Uncharacterized protein n=1 Tax=Asaia bogorensis NBRC 16594 TaxID=1231624 RepID=A0AAN4R3T7_9PROT|nr:hypothetical protein Asbog_01373 [Asaia bogorensis NBRC 16594]GEL53855.1 hypothetical protein ABO01nite_18620 [Asaia bogorensis NBRC 16594]
MGSPGAHWLELPYLLIMAIHARRRDVKAAVIAESHKTHFLQAFQTRLVAQILRTAYALAEKYTMQRRATARFEIGFIPHDAASILRPIG